MSCSTINKVLSFEILCIKFTALSVSLFDIPAVGSSSNIVSAPPAIVMPISNFLYEKIGIPIDKIYISFVDVSASMWAWNGRTFG